MLQLQSYTVHFTFADKHNLCEPERQDVFENFTGLDNLVNQRDRMFLRGTQMFPEQNLWEPELNQARLLRSAAARAAGDPRALRQQGTGGGRRQRGRSARELRFLQFS